MIVQQRGPATGGDVQTIQILQQHGIFQMPGKDSLRLHQGPAMLIVGVGIAILLLAVYYLLPRTVQRYLAIL
jgi:hypothetical protein